MVVRHPRVHGRDAIEWWKRQARTGEWNGFIENVLLRHYDPAYRRSTLNHYSDLSSALQLTVATGGSAEFAHLARQCVEAER
jgi:tRNA 2-selenouridine synthase